MHFSEQTQTSEELAAHRDEIRTIVDSMVGTTVYVTTTRSPHVGFTCQITATLESNGDGYYYINNTVVSMDFRVSQIQDAWLAASSNIIRLS